MLEPRLQFWDRAANTTTTPPPSATPSDQFTARPSGRVARYEVQQLFKTVLQKCAAVCVRQVGIGTLGVLDEVILCCAVPIYDDTNRLVSFCRLERLWRGQVLAM
jgi:hypothetical protein